MDEPVKFTTEQKNKILNDGMKLGEAIVRESVDHTNIITKGLRDGLKQALEAQLGRPYNPTIDSDLFEAELAPRLGMYFKAEITEFR